MRNFCCVLSLVLFAMAASLAFDNNNTQFFYGPQIAVANLVRGLAALGFCLGGGCAIIAAALSPPLPPMR